MTSRSNKGVIFAEIPGSGLPPPSTFQVKDREIDLDEYELNAGDVLLRNLYLSVDSGMRSLMRPDINVSYIGGFKLGEVLFGPGIAEVVKSNNEKYVVGDVVFSLIGWEEYTHVTARTISLVNVTLSAAQRKEQNKGSEFPLSYYLGVLGMSGLSAYAGLKKIADMKAGETIFVSAAAGAVGHIVGQIAKISGLRVIGSVGNDAKVEYLINELKYDAAFNYKKVDLDQKLKETCPNGIDIYFDNVGGETLDIALTHLNNNARIPVCGMTSQYNNDEPYGVKNLGLIMGKRVKIQGFTVLDYYNELFKEFLIVVGKWLEDGQIKCREHVTIGIENAPQAFWGMFKGENVGKTIVKIADL